ncbi:MAG: phosphopantothenoylcysteine decarboxylase, partial [Paramuribaculum sp.]|nr:phosphopantothenoylcysteine decarboxylase [Paramuribaculum sp.]
GPTYERIDPVRFIGNFSTGKMGYAIADAAAEMGADVTVVSGPVSVTPRNTSVKVVSVESARQMLEACEKVWSDSDIAIMCAAVADYAPLHPAASKIKREGHEIPTIELTKNPDIAATLGAKKRPDQTLVGFALETDNEEFNAQSKLKSKNLDMIVLNSLRNPQAGFATDTNQVTIFKADGTRADFPVKPKTELAFDILNAIID